MKFYLFCSVLFFFSQTSWEEFVSLDGRFKVLTPAPMIEVVDSVQTEVGTLAYHVFYHEKEEVETDYRVFMVSYCDYPEGIIFADSTGLAEEFLNETMQTAAESMKGEIVYSTDIKMEEHPGKQWRINYLEGHGVIKTKAFLVDNRYYSIQVITTKKLNTDKENNQFLDSFQFL